MVGTDASIFFIFFFGYEVFTTVAIPTLVFGGVNIVFEALPNQLNATFVGFVGRADKVGWRDAEFFDKIAEFLGVFLYVGFDGEIFLFGFFKDFVAVFVGSGLEF